MTAPTDPAPVVPVAVPVAAEQSNTLAYAPVARSAKRPAGVIVAGLFTTALSLLGIYLLDVFYDVSVMGWYANYVIPVGALLVGVCAGLGYGITSWITGVRIHKQLLWLIVLLQVWAYFAAEYVSFRAMGPLINKQTGAVLTFPHYYHVTAVNWAWKDEHTDKVGEPLGMAGYFFRLLEVVGFVGGSLIVPAALIKTPYCELCQAYMKTKTLLHLPAGPPARRIKKKDTVAMEAYQQELRAGMEQAETKLNELADAASAGDAPKFSEQIAAHLPTSKAAAKLPVRVRLNLVRCKLCASG